MVNRPTQHIPFGPPPTRTVLQVPRAVVASALAAVVDVGLLAALVQWLNMPPVPAAAISYSVGGIVNYAICAVWVFPNAPPNAMAGCLAFLALGTVGLGITAGVVWLGTRVLGLHYFLAKILALGLAFAWNFASRKYLLFRPGREDSDGAVGPTCPGVEARS